MKEAKDIIRRLTDLVVKLCGLLGSNSRDTGIHELIIEAESFVAHASDDDMNEAIIFDGLMRQRMRLIELIGSRVTLTPYKYEVVRIDKLIRDILGLAEQTVVISSVSKVGDIGADLLIVDDPVVDNELSDEEKHEADKAELEKHKWSEHILHDVWEGSRRVAVVLKDHTRIELVDMIDDKGTAPARLEIVPREEAVKG